jgi:manganese transport system ATP-binding protein
MQEMPLTSSAIVAQDVVLTYGAKVAIEGSSFAIPAGGITALIGPNGSGKSTLLAAIAGLIEPASGQIELVGSHGETRQPRVSFVLQSTAVNESLPITVREVVTMGRYSTTGAHARLSAVDLSAVDAAMARMGVERLADQQLSELSGGQKQRVFVAQGLAQEHEILLLDEPLTGLDLISAQAIDGVIHDETNTGCTIVMSTHDLAEAHVADYVLLLDRRVVASGHPTEVLTMENLNMVYGANLLHVEGEQLFIDDPAHRPVPGRHVHRDRSG